MLSTNTLHVAQGPFTPTCKAWACVFLSPFGPTCKPPRIRPSSTSPAVKATPCLRKQLKTHQTADNVRCRVPMYIPLHAHNTLSTQHSVRPFFAGGAMQVETAKKKAMPKKMQINAFAAPPPPVKMVHVTQICPSMATIKGN